MSTEEDPYAGPRNWDLVATEQLGPVITHGPDKCGASVCVIHNPSDHHMLTWELSFDPNMEYLATRVCPHGRWHPDPDSVAYFAHVYGADAAPGIRLHLCDGCCHPEQP